MEYIVAVDSFKGCLSSIDAGLAVEAGLKSVSPTAAVRVMDVSDGGEGMLDAFISATGGERVAVEAHDALMRPVAAFYGVAGDTAVVEVAQACGLQLVEPSVRDAVAATSWGVGEIIADAIGRGCRSFIVGLGGTATTDGGIGMLKALVSKLAPRGGHFADASPLLRQCSFTLASDVSNPLCGEEGAAHVFAPQKGASADDVRILERRLQRFARLSARHFGYDRSAMPGAGAAGGLGYAFLQYLDAEFRGGADLLLGLLGFDGLLDGAEMVITGEGKADRQTLMGKLPMAVLGHASRCGVPVMLVCGQLADSEALLAAGFKAVVCINPPGLALDEAMRPGTAKRNIARAVACAVGG